MAINVPIAAPGPPNADANCGACSAKARNALCPDCDLDDEVLDLMRGVLECKPA